PIAWCPFVFQKTGWRVSIPLIRLINRRREVPLVCENFPKSAERSGENIAIGNPSPRTSELCGECGARLQVIHAAFGAVLLRTRRNERFENRKIVALVLFSVIKGLAVSLVGSCPRAQRRRSEMIKHAHQHVWAHDHKERQDCLNPLRRHCLTAY